MILIYLLFALTVSMVLTAFAAARMPQKRSGEVFIGLFIVFVLIAWAADAWLVPAIAAGLKVAWLPVVLLIVFGGVLTASAILSTSPLWAPAWALEHNHSRLDAEATVFDFALWFMMLVFGIVVLKAIGM